MLAAHVFGSCPRTVYILRTNNGSTFSLHGNSAPISHLLPRTAAPNAYTQFQMCQLAQQIFRGAAIGIPVELWEQSGSKPAWIATGTVGNPDDLLDQLASSGGDEGSGAGPVSSDVNPVVASVHVEDGSVAVAVLDLLVYELYLVELPPSDVLGAVVEPVLVQLGVRECLLPAGAAGGAGLNLADIAIEARSYPRNELLWDDLERLVDVDAGMPLPKQLAPAMHRALGALLAYLCLPAKRRLLRIVPFRSDQFVRLDETALRALHVFPPRNASRFDANASLHGLLSAACQTGQGRRLLERWLRQPLLSLAEIAARQDAVYTLTVDHTKRKALQEGPLKGIGDLSRLFKRICRRTATLQDLAALYTVITRIPALTTALSASSASSGFSGAIDGCFDSMQSGLKTLADDLGPFIAMLDQMLDWPATERHEYLVRPDYDPDLLAISAQRAKLMEEMHAEWRRVSEELLELECGKRVKFEQSLVHGHCMRISRLVHTQSHRLLSIAFLHGVGCSGCRAGAKVGGPHRACRTPIGRPAYDAGSERRQSSLRQPRP